MDKEFFQRKVQSRLASFDHDKDGVITRADVDMVTGRALGAFGVAATSAQGKALSDAAGTFWSQVAADADGDRDGEIRQEEFFEAVACFQRAAQPWIRALVSAADRDGDGKLTAQEYRTVLQALGADKQALRQLDQRPAAPIPVEAAQITALEFFADHKPYSPATWSFGKF
ncbi:EF-hand domain-containing protein [Nonomuraea sp. NPDC059007]|uniref:EF-hand domain-containing protein n=1 Tax=Nonomuraea sp. NPDC059007 TaxID=3346692 RepID=UPI0036C7A526